MTVTISPVHRLAYDIDTVNASEMSEGALMKAKAEEGEALHKLWVTERRDELAARLMILRHFGWTIGELANHIVVSRVTLYKLMREVDETKIHHSVTETVKRPAVDFRPMTTRMSDAGLRFAPDRPVVPVSQHKTLVALSRMAFKARGSSAAGHRLRNACTNDCMDVYVSMLLRRGVSNLAIAEAAGITHRAVLDRMRRARQREYVLTKDEMFYGDRDILSLADGVTGNDPAWLTSEADTFVAIQTLQDTTKPSRNWLKVLVGDDGNPIVFHSGGPHKRVDPMARRLTNDGILKPMSDKDLAVADTSEYSYLRSEFRIAMLLSTFRTARPLAERTRGPGENVHLVPTDLYYGELIQKHVGDSAKGRDFIPQQLFTAFFETCEDALIALGDPDTILEDVKPIPKRTEESEDA